MCNGNSIKCFVVNGTIGQPTMDGKYIIRFDNNEVLPPINHCMQCEYAVDVSTSLYTCDGDQEDLVYCRYHDVMCRALRQPCDWARVAID